jgi:hypothetical protein
MTKFQGSSILTDGQINASPLNLQPNIFNKKFRHFFPSDLGVGLNNKNQVNAQRPLLTL